MDKKSGKNSIIPWTIVGAMLGASFGAILGIIAYNYNWLG